METVRRAFGPFMRVLGCLAVALVALALAAPVSAIIGGAAVAPGTWSWAVRISVAEPGEDGLCTGSLVAPSVVLTAAHCVVDPATGAPYALSKLTVLTGRGDVDDTSQGQLLAVDGVQVDPAYSPATVHADVALLQLAAPSTSRVIALATAADAADYGTGGGTLVAGWGLADPAATTPPDTLQSLAVLVRSNADCASALAGSQPYAFDAATMYCGSAEDPAAGICRGDSGGPAISLDAANELIEVGVVSWSLSGCEHPDVFVRLTSVLGWLTPQIAALQASAPKPAPPAPPVTETVTTAPITTAPATPVVITETLTEPPPADDTSPPVPTVVDAEGPGTLVRRPAATLLPARFAAGHQLRLAYRITGSERFRAHIRITEGARVRYAHTTGWLTASGRRRTLGWRVPASVVHALRACIWATTATDRSPAACATLAPKRP